MEMMTTPWQGGGKGQQKRLEGDSIPEATDLEAVLGKGIKQR